MPEADPAYKSRRESQRVGSALVAGLSAARFEELPGHANQAAQPVEAGARSSEQERPGTGRPRHEAL